MTDAREVLAEIQQWAINGPVSDWDPHCGDEPHHRVIERQIRFDKQIRTDVPRLVAALTAVLDLHKPYDSAQTPHEIDDCTCGMPGPYPCATVRAITEALGGGS